MSIIKMELTESACKSGNRSFYVSFVLSIIIISLIITSLVNIEKSNCECANISNKNYIKEWFIFALVFQVSLFLFFILGSEPCYYRFINGNSLYIIMLIFAVVNYIMLFRLLFYLRIMRNSCECGYGNIEKFLFWYLVILFSIVALFILLGLIVLITTGFKFMK